MGPVRNRAVIFIQLFYCQLALYKVYPNPVKSLLNIEVNIEHAGRLVISNALGEQMGEQEVEAGNKTGITLNVSDWPKGVYFISIQGPEGRRLRGRLLVN